MNMFITLYTNTNYLLGTLSKKRLSKTPEKKKKTRLSTKKRESRQKLTHANTVG